MVTVSYKRGFKPHEAFESFTDEQLVTAFEAMSPRLQRHFFQCRQREASGLLRAFLGQHARPCILMICPVCNGKGFVHPDGTPDNAFDGSDQDVFVVCLDCEGTGHAKSAGTDSTQDRVF
jgi:hypothetical protein